MNSHSDKSLKKGLEQLNITLDESQIHQFLEYYELLIEWNKVMNLTGITEYEEVISKHFIDSLAVVKACDFSKVKTVIDVGTGAGFPGIPLKIAFPDLEVVLLDSLNKRIKFLNEVISSLSLEGIKTIHGRAEDFARQKEYREKFDLCVSRAVANLSSLSEYCLPYVKTGGYFIPYKSGKIEEELSQAQTAIRKLGGKTEETIKFTLMETDQSRSLIKIEKQKSTPAAYPRKAGLPTREPLQ